jgi:hypothetical protein
MANKKFPRIVGINQLADETALNHEGVMYVREANNVDIDSAGNVSRRKGASLELAGSGYHSLFMSTRGWMLIGKNNQLGIYDPSGKSFTPLVNMDDALRTSYTELNGNLYAMNSSFGCKFLPGSFDYNPIGVPLPIVSPVFAAAAGGLNAGSYGVTFTVVDPNGEESGTAPVVQIDLPDGGGVVGTMFTVASGYKHRIYMTTADGERLYQAAEFDADVTTYTVATAEEGRECETHGMEQPPNGHIIRAHGSRLLIGTTNYVYYTDTFRPHLHSPTGFVPINGFCTMVESVDGGVFIGDNNGVHFYVGDDPTVWEQKAASGDKVVFGTSVQVSGSFFGEDFVEHDSVAVWLTSSGYQVGLPTGQVVRLNSSQVKTPAYSQGSSAVLVSNGQKQMVTPVNSNELAGASVSLDSVTI